MKSRFLFLGMALLALGGNASVAPSDNLSGRFIGRPEVGAFITEMADRYGFKPDILNTLFEQAVSQPQVIKAMSQPVTGKPKPWPEYEANFLTAQRVSKGVEFWEANKQALARAKEEFGVPEEIIVAIIGVETLYGNNKGNFRTFDALATLAFDYPRRAEFFRSELEQYLLLTRELEVDPLSLSGSFAGAMGIPQFMPGSCRRYAIDYNGDSKIDIWNDPQDAIGSVAYFLSRHGWQPNDAVMVKANVSGEQFLSLMNQGINQLKPVDAWKQVGVSPETYMANDKEAVVFVLDGGEIRNTEYWMGFQNFYTITRYNRSTFYATAVYRLSQLIKASRVSVAEK